MKAKNSELHSKTSKDILLITWPSEIPQEIHMGISYDRHDQRVTHEEAGIILVNQVMHASALDYPVKVISDDTDVIVLLLIFYTLQKLINSVFMQATSGECSIVDIGRTATLHYRIVPYLLLHMPYLFVTQLQKCMVLERLPS